MTDNKIYRKFDGKRYGGNKGDTIASARLRNNVKLVGRSFKYHVRTKGYLYLWNRRAKVWYR